MLNLTFAPSADTLAPLAGDRILGAWRDPFNPPAVVVPNPAVGKWLNIRLAETPSVGCVANARMSTLERFLWDALEPDPDMELINAGHLSQVICALLDEETLRGGVYKPLRDYLYAAAGSKFIGPDNDGRANDNSRTDDDHPPVSNNGGKRTDHSIDAIKRVQLSARIAQQFLEYEYNRPSVWSEEASRWGRHGIDAKWLLGKEYFEGREHEAWQMDLYRRASECLSKSASPRYTTLPHLYRRRREERAKEKRRWCDVGSNRQIILFGVSKISHFHRNTLVEISQSAGVDMHVFLTNPCAEFWEDVDTSRRTRVPRRRWNNNSPDEDAGIKPVKPEDYDKGELPDKFADEADHALLKLWGAAGKENIFLWCPQAQWNFEYYGGIDDDGINSGIDTDVNTNIGDETASTSKEGAVTKGLLNVPSGLPRRFAPRNDVIASVAKQSRRLQQSKSPLLLQPPTDVNTDGVNTVNIPVNTNTTLLKAIQRSLLSRNNELGFINNTSTRKNKDNDQSKDRSLQILACPDLSREVEEARELILDMAYDNTINSFSDIAVYMPDPDKYAPYIQRVFGAYPHGHPEYIPFTVIGASGGSSLAARALSALLGIAGGGFNRAAVFELLDNPVVRESRGFSRRDLERWEEWAEEYGMFRGYNAEQRGLMGDKGGAVIDHHTFERGMRRVLESAEMADDGAERSAELFLALLKELGELSAFFSVGGGLLDIREAVETVRRAIWLWLGRIGGGLAYAAAETRIRREALNELALIELQYTCANRDGISREEFLTLARGCVAGELTTPSAAWRGVTFAPLRASMVLPHRAIFVMGLCAAEFPGTNEAPSWDLLPSKRIVGDSDRVRDNRFAFLELLHAAKERLILSYKARDMQKDEELQPSSVVLELEEYLIGQRLVDCNGNSRKCSVRREVPWVVHETLNAAREAGRKHGSWDKEQRILAMESLKERVRHRHELSINRSSSTHIDTSIHDDPSIIHPAIKCRTYPTQTGEHISTTLNYRSSPLQNICDPACRGELRSPAVVSINQNDAVFNRHLNNNDSSAKTADLRDLKQFLSNPLEYHLCRTLGIRNDEDTGDMAATDEPLDSGYKIFALRRKLWAAILNIILSDEFNDTDKEWASVLPRVIESAVDSAEKIYDEHVESGQAPEGHICRMEREGLVNWAKECVKASEDMYNKFKTQQFEEKRDSFLSCGGFTINVRHELIIMPEDTDNQHSKIGVIAFDRKVKTADNLKLWLDGLAIWLNEMRDGGKRRQVVLIGLNHDDKPKAQTSLMSMDDGKLHDMEKWLADMLSQMLINKACEHLPYSVIADTIKPERKGTESYEERIQKLTARSLRDNIVKYTAYTEAFNLTDANPPVMDDGELRELAEIRYAPIFGRWIHE